MSPFPFPPSALSIYHLSHHFYIWLSPGSSVHIPNSDTSKSSLVLSSFSLTFSFPLRREIVYTHFTVDYRDAFLLLYFISLLLCTWLFGSRLPFLSNWFELGVDSLSVRTMYIWPLFFGTAMTDPVCWCSRQLVALRRFQSKEVKQALRKYRPNFY